MKRMELTFWHKGKQPGEVIEVRDEEVRSWRGFARLLPDSAQPGADRGNVPPRAESMPSVQEEPPKEGAASQDAARPAAKAKAATPPAKA